MDKLLYNDYVRRLSDKLHAQFDSIMAGYNFDFGPEFEIALCRVLINCLPQKFGVCRGFVVDADGEMRGDDIIIFAQDRFFTLRHGVGLDLTLKEQIPIEASIAYIEAKHTLILEGEGPASLHKAIKQVEKVKALCAKREPVKLGSWNPWVENPINYLPPAGFSINNPMYGVIFARNVKLTANSSDYLSPSDIEKFMHERTHEVPPGRTLAPDLMVLGDSNIVTPSISENGESFFSPFMSPISNYGTKIVPGISYGVGFACLQFALDWIKLGKLPWPQILSNALGIRSVDGGPGSPTRK
ncbi:DUF6602 domain-containing protein [uncultured Desulfobacter sp.]|uniref:DUF6602 domain-containing protein n=1 Tax=uncultured Desulfobacter sp. TaxID=240139 RepID=UPI002AA8CB64|nr:DUF6602 domain-containing protein [uncultured Desulfobacter sp.]